MLMHEIAHRGVSNYMQVGSTSSVKPKHDRKNPTKVRKGHKVKRNLSNDRSNFLSHCHDAHHLILDNINFDW